MAVPNINGDATLRAINDLTRMSPTPGFLDYHTYIAYLGRLGHVRRQIAPHNSSGLSVPLNTFLEDLQAAHTHDSTSFRADQALWSLEHMPEILYEFRRPAYWLGKTELEEPPTKPYLVHGQQLRDIPILPDHISSKLEGWRYEAWSRMDPRISAKDIHARMGPGSRGQEHSRVQMRVARFRNECNLLGWVTRGGNYHATETVLVTKLQGAGIDLNQNTTRGLSWGLINPILGDAGGRVAATRQSLQSVEDQPAQLTVLASSFPVYQVQTTLQSIAPAPPVPRPVDSNISVAHVVLNEPGEGAAPSRTTNLPTVRFPNASLLERSQELATSSNNKRKRGSDEVPKSPDSTPRSEKLQSSRVLPKKGRVQYRRVTVAYGSDFLTLRTEIQRQNLTPAKVKLLATCHPAGSPERLRQLEFVLDPHRAPFGFTDNHGYLPCVGDSHLEGAADEGITYHLDKEEGAVPFPFVERSDVTPAVNEPDTIGSRWAQPGAAEHVVFPPIGWFTTRLDPDAVSQDKVDSEYPPLESQDNENSKRPGIE